MGLLGVVPVESTMSAHERGTERQSGKEAEKETDQNREHDRGEKDTNSKAK